MATQEQVQEQERKPTSSQDCETLLSSYLGLSFSIFLGFLPKSSISFVSALQIRNKDLSFKLFQAEEQHKQLHSRRKEDSKANARVVEIFASHRHAWQQEEKRLLLQIDASAEEIACLRGRIEEFEKVHVELRANVEELQRELKERDEMLNFMAMKSSELNESMVGGGFDEMGSSFGKLNVSEGMDQAVEDCFLDRGVDDMASGVSNVYRPGLINSASKFYAERPNLWQDVQYEPVESPYNLKHFVARRESPWKVDGESAGVSCKLKLLEQELVNLERVGKSDLSKVPSIMRKQAKRYQGLSGKIDDLCRRMQANDPCEPTLGPEFRTQKQTEFLLEAFRLQQRASETGQKLVGLRTETGKNYIGDELEGQAKLATRRSLDSIKNNFKEIQRNLEIWLARIIGDLEGILARDGASRVSDYYISRYPFIQ